MRTVQDWKVGNTNYISVAKYSMLYNCDIMFSNGLVEQDGAPSHTAADTVNLLLKEKINFIEPQSRPPNTPDPNPVDYAIWGALQQQVYLRRQFEI